MADTCNAAVKKLSAVTHNGVAILSPEELSYQETVEFAEHRPAARISPCIALMSYSLQATVRRKEITTPIVRNTQGDLVATLLQIAGTTLTLTLTGMVAGQDSGVFPNTDIASQEQQFHFSTSTENFAPISVA